MAPNAPRFPLARHASARLTIRSFSADVNVRFGRRGTLSTAPPRAPRARSRCTLSAVDSCSSTGIGFGTFFGPVSAHLHMHFQEGLSHETLARGVSAFTAGAKAVEGRQG